MVFVGRYAENDVKISKDPNEYIHTYVECMTGKSAFPAGGNREWRGACEPPVPPVSSLCPSPRPSFSDTQTACHHIQSIARYTSRTNRYRPSIRHSIAKAPNLVSIPTHIWSYLSNPSIHAYINPSSPTWLLPLPAQS